MVGKNFIKRGLVVALVALAAIGMLSTAGVTVGNPAGHGAGVGSTSSSTGQGQNGQCDRAGFANVEAGTFTPNLTELLAARISSYKHPCAGPLLFNSFAQLPPDGSLWSVRVRATCVSGCSGTFWGDPGGSAQYYMSHDADTNYYEMHPYNGAFPNLPVGLYNIDLLIANFSGFDSTVSIRSIQVQSYSGPGGGGGGIGG